MNKSELKACPFCDGRPEMDCMRGYRAMTDGRMGSGVAIYCTRCDCEMMLCREDLPECDTDELIEMLASQWNKRAGDRQPAPSETVGVKGVGMSDLLDLLASANQLNEIVEGVRETRWAFDDMRLKDTKEWCDFYVKLKRAARRSNEKLRHGANNPNA